MSTSMIDYARRLLSGEVICRWTDSDAFDVIEQEDVQYLLNEHLSFLGAKIALTPNDNGFYLIMDPLVIDVKKRSKEVFTDVLKNYRTVLSWMSIFMKSMSPDRPVLGGDTFRVVDIHSHVSNDPTLQNDLNRIKKIRGDNTRKQLDSLVADLVNKRILVEIDKNHEIYRFTAKIDLINEYLEFIADHESIGLEETVGNQQKALL